MPYITVATDSSLIVAFDTPEEARTTAQILGVSLDPYGAGIPLLSFLQAATRMVEALPDIVGALRMNSALVERAGQRCETPPSWSFNERDSARAAADFVLRGLQEVPPMSLDVQSLV